MGSYVMKWSQLSVGASDEGSLGGQDSYDQFRSFSVISGIFNPCCHPLEPEPDWQLGVLSLLCHLQHQDDFKHGIDRDYGAQ